MEHWIEPKFLGSAQRSGPGSPIVQEGGELPALPQPPQQLGGVREFMGGSVLGCLACGALGFFLGSMFTKWRVKRAKRISREYE